MLDATTRSNHDIVVNVAAGDFGVTCFFGEFTVAKSPACFCLTDQILKFSCGIGEELFPDRIRSSLHTLHKPSCNLALVRAPSEHQSVNACECLGGLMKTSSN